MITISRRGLLALTAAAAIVAALVLLAGGPESEPEPVRPAPADAPLNQQLRALERAVDRAAGQRP